MKTRNMKFRKAVHFYWILFSIFILATETNAQADCKRKLDDYNGREYIPTGQIGSYETCIDNLVTYYKGLKTTERNLDTQIRNVENDIAKNQSNLEVAMDSTSKDRYKGFNSNADLKKR
jgi:predicted  nucleic acid-binding Zn-ribbon protein